MYAQPRGPFSQSSHIISIPCSVTLWGCDLIAPSEESGFGLFSDRAKWSSSNQHSLICSLNILGAHGLGSLALNRVASNCCPSCFSAFIYIYYKEKNRLNISKDGKGSVRTVSAVSFGFCGYSMWALVVTIVAIVVLTIAPPRTPQKDRPANLKLHRVWTSVIQYQQG
jgi:hypothetical protein